MNSRPAPASTRTGASFDQVTSVFIGYATRSGTSHDIAAVVSETLEAIGCRACVADLRDQPALGDADLVVLGSGIQAGAWYPEATAWLAAHEGELRGRRVAVFNACLNAAKPGKRDDSLAYNEAAIRRTGAQISESFPGRFVPAKVGFFRRVFLRVMQQEPQDHLDPAVVRAWAAALPEGGGSA